jgi:hypothetical protein
VAFAAKAGSTALDGTGGNSPFARAIMSNLTVPGLDVRIAFGRVRDAVLRDTSRQQEPFVYGSLGGSTIALVPANPPLLAEKGPAAPVEAPTIARRNDDGGLKDTAKGGGDKLAIEARSFVTRLHAIMAEPDAAALAFVSAAYSEPANVYGKVTLPAVALAEKRRFLARWPIRRYVQRSDLTKVTCDPSLARCQVTGIVDYEVANPTKGTRSAGSSTFEYDLRLASGRIDILREDGRVLRGR